MTNTVSVGRCSAITSPVVETSLDGISDPRPRWRAAAARQAESLHPSRWSSVPNHREGSGLRLKPGMVLAIEPMLNIGSGAVRVLDDGWTVVTADASLSAHVEHTVAVTSDGPRILTVA